MSKCCSLKTASVILVAIVAIFFGLLTLTSEPTPVNQIERTIPGIVDASKFPLFLGPVIGKTVHHFKSEKAALSVPTVLFVNDDSIRDIVEHRQPAVLLGSSASKWKALDWDLWELAKKLPLLLGTAVTEDTSASSSDSSVLLLEHEREPGGMLTDEGSLAPAAVMDDIFFVNFLIFFKDVTKRMFYSSDFRIFERMIKVCDILCKLTCY
jgi:hypothetical protein